MSSLYRAAETDLPSSRRCDPRAFPIRAWQSHQPQGVHLEGVISQDASQQVNRPFVVATLEICHVGFCHVSVTLLLIAEMI